MLINGCNTCFLCIFGAFEINLFPVQIHFALFSLMYACDDFDKGRLTRTVLSHQCMDLTRLQLKAHAVQSLNARKNLGNAF